MQCSLDETGTEHHPGLDVQECLGFGERYGTDTTRVMLWASFHILGLNTVFLITLESNKRAQRAYEKAGFKHAGVLRQSAYMLGKFHDFVVMDVTKKEFFEMYPPGTEVGQP